MKTIIFTLALAITLLPSPSYAGRAGGVAAKPAEAKAPYALRVSSVGADHFRLEYCVLEAAQASCMPMGKAEGYTKAELEKTVKSLSHSGQKRVAGIAAAALAVVVGFGAPVVLAASGGPAVISSYTAVVSFAGNAPGLFVGTQVGGAVSSVAGATAGSWTAWITAGAVQLGVYGTAITVGVRNFAEKLDPRNYFAARSALKEAEEGGLAGVDLASLKALNRSLAAGELKDGDEGRTVYRMVNGKLMNPNQPDAARRTGAPAENPAEAPAAAPAQ